MREKLLHALLICIVFKMRMYLETLDISIFVRSFQKKPEIVYSESVFVTDVYDQARVSLLSYCDFTSFISWFKYQISFSYLEMLFIQITGYSDDGTRPCLIDSTPDTFLLVFTVF